MVVGACGDPDRDAAVQPAAGRSFVCRRRRHDPGAGLRSVPEDTPIQSASTSSIPSGPPLHSRDRWAFLVIELTAARADVCSTSIACFIERIEYTKVFL